MYSANNRTPQKASTAFMTVLAIWTLSILLSFPLFFGTNLEVIQMPESVVRMIHDDSIAYCAEKWGEYEKGRLVYSCFILVMQVCQNWESRYPQNGVEKVRKAIRSDTASARQIVLWMRLNSRDWWMTTTASRRFAPIW